MRTFVLFSRKGVTTSNFSLNDLPGSGGRMDLICRCVNSALWISCGLRRDTRIFLVLNGPSSPPATILFEGSSLRRVSPDERNIASWIKKALDCTGKNGDWVKVQEGIKVSKMSFQDVIKDLKEIYVLHERGRFIREVEIAKNPVFVLGDNIGLPRKEEKFAERFGAEKISLGKTSYLASHCISMIHYEMDTREILLSSN